MAVLFDYDCPKCGHTVGSFRLLTGKDRHCIRCDTLLNVSKRQVDQAVHDEIESIMKALKNDR